MADLPVWPLVVLVRAYFENWRDFVVVERRGALGAVNDSFGLYQTPSISSIQHATIL